MFALRITEELSLEETSEGHLAQPSAPTISRQLLHIPKDGESTDSLAACAMFIHLHTGNLNLFPSAHLQSEIWKCCLKSMGKEVLNTLPVGDHIYFLYGSLEIGNSQ